MSFTQSWVILQSYTQVPYDNIIIIIRIFED